MHLRCGETEPENGLLLCRSVTAVSDRFERQYPGRSTSLTRAETIEPTAAPPRGAASDALRLRSGPGTGGTPRVPYFQPHSFGDAPAVPRAKPVSIGRRLRRSCDLSCGSGTVRLSA